MLLLVLYVATGVYVATSVVCCYWWCVVATSVVFSAVEWCRNDDFNLVAGDFVMTDLRATEYVIPDLDQVSTHTCPYGFCKSVSPHWMRLYLSDGG